MKRIALFAFFILLFQVSYGVIPVLSQQADDASQIKGVVEEFRKAYENNDPAAALQCISKNYSAGSGEQVRGYEEAKKNIEAEISWFFSNYVDLSFKRTPVDIIKLDPKKNKAVVSWERELGGFNLNTLNQEQLRGGKIIAYFAKENGAWKIIEFDKNPVLTDSAQ